MSKPRVMSRYARLGLTLFAIVFITTTSILLVQAHGAGHLTAIDPDDESISYPDDVPATPAKLTSSSGCDPTLWSHVHQPSRLKVYDNCKQITGTIVATQAMGDGDVHILLWPDIRQFHLMNAKNILFTRAALVVEAICARPPIEAGSKPACAGYHSNVTIPPVGSHVAATGSYVSDTPHGWNEIHPVTSIVKTR